MNQPLRNTITTILGHEPTWHARDKVAFTSRVAPTSGMGVALAAIGLVPQLTKGGAYIYRQR